MHKGSRENKSTRKSGRIYWTWRLKKIDSWHYWIIFLLSESLQKKKRRGGEQSKDVTFMPACQICLNYRKKSLFHITDESQVDSKSFEYSGLE